MYTCDIYSYNFELRVYVWARFCIWLFSRKGQFVHICTWCLYMSDYIYLIQYAYVYGYLYYRLRVCYKYIVCVYSTCICIKYVYITHQLTYILPHLSTELIWDGMCYISKKILYYVYIYKSIRKCTITNN